MGRNIKFDAMDATSVVALRDMLREQNNPALTDYRDELEAYLLACVEHARKSPSFVVDNIIEAIRGGNKEWVESGFNPIEGTKPVAGSATIASINVELEQARAVASTDRWAMLAGVEGGPAADKWNKISDVVRSRVRDMIDENLDNPENN